jgi:hypothetical protein
MAKEEWNTTVGKKQDLRFGCFVGLKECSRATRHLFYEVNY